MRSIEYRLIYNFQYVKWSINSSLYVYCDLQADRLRKVVVNREVPGFRPKLSSRVLKASVDLLAPLNDQQRRAVFQTLAADHYLLIKGMPGTGTNF